MPKGTKLIIMMELCVCGASETMHERGIGGGEAELKGGGSGKTKNRHKRMAMFGGCCDERSRTNQAPHSRQEDSQVACICV